MRTRIRLASSPILSADVRLKNYTMSMAICIRCGAEKAKPRGTCHSCGFRPRSDDDIARSIAASDRGWLHDPSDAPNVTALREIGERIRTGQPSGIREEVVADLLTMKSEKWSRSDIWATARFFSLLLFVPVLALLIWLLWK